MSDKNYYSILKINPNKYFIDHIYQSDDCLQIYVIKKKEKFYLLFYVYNYHLRKFITTL